MRAAWLLVAALCRPALTGAGDADTGSAALERDRKQLVVACNGFADSRPALVGARPASTEGAAHAHTGHHRRRHVRLVVRRGGWRKRHLRPALLQLSANVAHGSALPAPEAPGPSALWQRPLGYGACEEYHMDLRRNKLFFVVPSGNSSCEVAGLDLADDSLPWEVNEKGFTLGHGSRSDGDFAAKFEGDDPLAAPGPTMVATAPASWPPSRVVAVLAEAPGGGCVGHAVALSPDVVRSPTPLEEGGGAPEAPAAELAVVDALAPGWGARAPRQEEPEEVEMDQEDARKGLPPLVPPPVDVDAVVRLEDAVANNAITAQTIGSRTLSFGRAYAVDPQRLHVVMEDLRGARVLGREEADLQAGRSYVGLRVGREGDAAHPQRLVLYAVRDQVQVADATEEA